MKPCLFCDTYTDRQAIPGGIVYEDDFVYAYHYSRLDEPNYLGHLMLITKRHVPGLAELTEAEGQAVGLGIMRLSHALKACTGAEKVYAEAYYEVNPHLHLILTARYPGTPPEYWRWNVGDWPAAPKGTLKEVAELCDRLRAQLREQK